MFYVRLTTTWVFFKQNNWTILLWAFVLWLLEVEKKVVVSEIGACPLEYRDSFDFLEEESNCVFCFQNGLAVLTVDSTTERQTDTSTFYI